jgi:hypothetical protein
MNREDAEAQSKPFRSEKVPLPQAPSSSRGKRTRKLSGSDEESPKHPPAPKAKGSTVFILGDSRPYRTVRSGGSRSYLPRNDGLIKERRSFGFFDFSF